MIGKIKLTDDPFKSPQQPAMLFEPQEDITPLEVAHVFTLLIKLVVAGQSHIPIPDWREYLQRYNLERHFKPEEPEADEHPR